MEDLDEIVGWYQANRLVICYRSGEWDDKNVSMT